MMTALAPARQSSQAVAQATSPAPVSLPQTNPVGGYRLYLWLALTTGALIVGGWYLRRRANPAR